MSQEPPLFIATVSSWKTLESLLPGGATHVVLGHPLCPGFDAELTRGKEPVEDAVSRLREVGAAALLSTPVVLLPGQAEPLLRKLENALRGGAAGFEISDPGLLPVLRERFPEALLVTGPFANVYNRGTALLLARHGAAAVCAAVESDLMGLRAIGDSGAPVSAAVFGRLPLAFGRRCLIRRLDAGEGADACGPDCPGLPERGLRWEAEVAASGCGLLSGEPVDLYDELPLLWAAGLRSFRAEGLGAPSSFGPDLCLFRSALEALRDGGSPVPWDRARGGNGFFWGRAGREKIRPMTPASQELAAMLELPGTLVSSGEPRPPLRSARPGLLPALMAPAGSFEAAEAAFANGADGIYVGLKGWSLRPGVFEFDEAALKRVVELAERSRGWTAACVNIRPYPGDEAAALDAVARAEGAGCQAVIVGDLGLLAAARARFPKLRLHASVQFSAASAEAVRFLEELGADVVVLSRSLESMSEVAQVRARTRAGLEVFVHGDVCTFHDSLCYLTGYLKRETVEAGQGHGLSRTVGCSNRGECTLVCKQPARLCGPGRGAEVNLRRADLNRLEWLEGLVRLPVDILKIEGRQFGPEYVSAATRSYRQALDALADGRHADVGGELRSLEEQLKGRDISYDYQREAWLGKKPG